MFFMQIFLLLEKTKMYLIEALKTPLFDRESRIINRVPRPGNVKSVFTIVISLIMNLISQFALNLN